MISAQAAHRFTLRQLFLGDTLLNWFLTAVLIAVPRTVDHVLGSAPVMPPIVYRAIGAAFLLYAAWQTVILVRKGHMDPADYAFASGMALVPVVLLTAALLFLPVPLRAVWRIVLWVGDVYMLFLGAWYIYLARHPIDQAPSGQPG